MSPSLLILTAALAVTGPEPAAPSAVSTSPPSEIRASNCQVFLIQDIPVPAERPGVMVLVEAREGMQVEPGNLLARIDDRQAQAEKRVAVSEQQVAKEQADNDVNVRYAGKAAEVALQEYKVNYDANAKTPGSKPHVVMMQLWLSYQKALLGQEQAAHEQSIAKLTVDAKAAKVEMADLDVQMRDVKAPFAGEVIEIHRKVGEWVNPGDPVVRLIQRDRLRVKASLSLAEVAPSEVNGQPVRVIVPLERGRVEEFRGKIRFVNPQVRDGGQYEVWAEVENRTENGTWLLRHGLAADMVIELNQATTQHGGDTAARNPPLR